MHITVVSDMAQLARMRSEWDTVYDADPEAQFFLSWTWLTPWIAGMKAKWMVLVARPNGETDRPVAFLPLRFRSDRELRKNGRAGRREVMMAGNSTADCTGFLCEPEFQDQAIPAFGRYLRKQEFDLCKFEYFSASRKRRQLFFSRFSRRDFELSEVTREVNRDGINNHVCPRISLPGDWDSYLATRLGGSTRQKVRRFLRKTDGGDAYRIVPADADTIERAMDIMQDLWLRKWGSRKGPMTTGIISNMRGLIRSAFDQDALFMPVLWHGDEPLGALASYVDRAKGSMLFYVGGCRTDINNPAPGTVLHAYSIRHAIAQGLRTYDFLRGDEAYKYAFGAEDHQLATVTIRPRKARTRAPVADRTVTRMPDWYSPPAQVVAQGGDALLAGKLRIGVNGLPATLTPR